MKKFLWLCSMLLMCVSTQAETEVQEVYVDYPGSIQTRLVAINKHGVILGNATFGATGFAEHVDDSKKVMFPRGDERYTRAFLFKDDNLFLIDHKGAHNVVGTAINDRDEIIGHIETDGLPYSTFVYSNGKITTLEYPDAKFIANDINNFGQVGGCVVKKHGLEYPFVYDNGRLRTIKGQQDLEPRGSILCLNDTGVAAGYLVDSDGRKYAAVYKSGMWQKVVPDKTDSVIPIRESVVVDITNSGDLCGYFSPLITSRLFLVVDGKFYDAGDAGASGITNPHINKHLTVVGNINHSINHGFIATPETGLKVYLGIRGRHVRSLMDINNHGDIVGTCEFDNKVYGYWAKSPLPHDDKVELPDPNNAPTFAPRNLIFITHGWDSNAEVWANELAAKFREELKKRGTLNQWEIIAYNWENTAKGLEGNYITKASNATQEAANIGKFWGEVFAQRKYEKVHLIAHSAGSWMIHQISRKINTEECEVRMTFLDAFVPDNTDGIKTLGKFADVSEQYFDGRHDEVEILVLTKYLIIGLAGHPLESATNNIDVSKYDDAERDAFEAHAWPYKWYIRSFGTGEGVDLSPALK